MKPIRIATNADYPLFRGRRTIEYLELESNGVIFWRGVDNLTDKENEIGFSFPVDIEFVKEFFTNIGRDLDISKLPSNIKLDPYEVNY